MLSSSKNRNYTIASAVFEQIGFMEASTKQSAGLIWILQNSVFVAIYHKESLVGESEHRIWQVSDSFNINDFIVLADMFDDDHEKAK